MAADDDGMPDTLSLFTPHLDWIDSQRSEMTHLLQRWVAINSHTFNLSGIEQQRRSLEEAFAELGGRIERRSVPDLCIIESDGSERRQPLGDALHIICRPEAPRQALLCIHMDTVYAKEDPFQQSVPLAGGRLNGPGVSDAKGGLVVMLYALHAFERFVSATGNDQLGWQVLLNADEEVGSPGSASLFAEIASAVDFGMLYEPSLPDGHLIAPRKGSGNFDVVVRGVACHAGRDFDQGRNAVVAAARIAEALSALNGRWPDTTFNVGRIDGGGPVNMVPAAAVVRFNVRYPAATSADSLRGALKEIVAEACEQDGIDATLHGDFTAPPKPLDSALQEMLGEFQECGEQLGISLQWRASGGVCDGNRLAALGVPNVDTLGVRGDRIHSNQEFVILDSLTERAKLSALYLMYQATKRK